MKLYSVAVDNYERIKKLRDKDMTLVRDKNREDELSIEKTKKIMRGDYERFKLGELSREEFITRKNLANKEIEGIKKGIEDRKTSNDEKYTHIEKEFDFFDENKRLFKSKSYY